MATRLETFPAAAEQEVAALVQPRYDAVYASRAQLRREASYNLVVQHWLRDHRASPQARVEAINLGHLQALLNSDRLIEAVLDPGQLAPAAKRYLARDTETVEPARPDSEYVLAEAIIQQLAIVQWQAMHATTSLLCHRLALDGEALLKQLRAWELTLRYLNVPQD